MIELGNIQLLSMRMLKKSLETATSSFPPVCTGRWNDGPMGVTVFFNIYRWEC